MRSAVCTLLFVLAAGCGKPGAPTTSGAEPPEDAAASDLRTLQGTWRCVRGVDRGKPVPADQLGDGEYEFRATVFTVREGGKEQSRSTFKLDTTQKPRVMRIDDPGQEPPVVEAIYELNGDTLKFAFTKKIDGKRPSSFELPPGADVQLLILERKK
jgi:uncharacterized protein (TIGR03067 family)